MKIGVMGTHSTGKTTYANRLLNNLLSVDPSMRNRARLLEEVARVCPFPINRYQTEKSACWLFYQQVLKELELSKCFKVLVCDRTVIDPLAYAWVCGFHDFVDMHLPFALQLFKTYDKVYFMRPVGLPVDDGVRDLDLEFRQDVDDCLKQWIIDHQLTVIELAER